MTYHAYFSDNILVSHRLYTAVLSDFWLIVFFACCFLLYKVFRHISTPNTRRWV